jgi:hypothetical protein
MDAIGASVSLIMAVNKRRKVFRECVVTEYIAAYNGDDWNYYWKCTDENENEFTFDWSDIVSGRVSFMPQ